LTFDPRTKLLLTVVFALLVILSGTLHWLLAELGLMVLVILMVGGGRAYVRWLGFVALTVLFWLAIGWWTLGFATALLIALRLTALMSVFFLFFHVTPPEDLGNALTQMGVPYVFAFVLTTSMQFVPVMNRKIRTIIDAQRARGIPLEPGFAALRHYPALFAPLLIQSFQLADELAEAMEARGFSRTGRTSLAKYRLCWYDWGAMLAAIVLLAGWIVLSY
jgi:energy-coupling factor transport system permease protein